MLTIEECYRVLGLDLNKKYSSSELKKTYYAFAKKYHPDKNPNDPNAKDIFEKIKDAYETLSNPYYVYNRAKRNKNFDIVAEIGASFDEGFFGKRFEVNLALSLFYDKVGTKLTVEHYVFDLPAGSGGIFSHIERGKGLAKDGQIGDLLLRIVIGNHNRFRLDGKNIVSTERCPLATLLKGGKMDVATMYGIKELRIPPGTPPMGICSIPNCGVNNSNYHLVIMDPIYPTTEELRTSQEWLDFKVNWD